MSTPTSGSSNESTFLQLLLQEQDQIQQTANQQNQTSAKQQMQLGQMMDTTQSLQSADLAAGLTKTGSGGSGFGAPQLTGPGVVDFSAQFGGLSGDKALSLTAILAAVLMASALISSDSWKSMFNEASDQMNMSAQLAPVIAQATESNWNAQAQISEQQANQSLIEGAVSIAMFGASCAMGAYMAWTAPADDALDEAANTTTTATRDAAARQAALEELTTDSGTDELSAAEQVRTPATNAAEEAANEAATTWGQVKAGLNSVWGHLTYGGSGVLEAIKSGINSAMFFGMLSQGISQLQNSTTQTNIANLQKQVGTWSGLEQELNVYVQYYQQAFQRTNSILQGIQEQVDNANQSLVSVAQSLASAVSQGFANI